jgi:hypothetical protein
LKAKQNQSRKLSSSRKQLKTPQGKQSSNNKENKGVELRGTRTADSGNGQFEQIDEISHKINSIIKSISASCHKTVSESNSKIIKLERHDTAERINRLQSKYQNGHKFDKNAVLHKLKQDQVKRPPLQEKFKSQHGPKWFD